MSDVLNRTGDLNFVAGRVSEKYLTAHLLIQSEYLDSMVLGNIHIFFDVSAVQTPRWYL